MGIALFTALYTKWLWTPRGGFTLILAVSLFFLVSYFDPNFKKVASAPDNVPIVGMIFIILFYLWYAMHQAKNNDERIAQGLGPNEGRGFLPESLLVARPRVHRADLPRPGLRAAHRVVDLPEGPAGRAREPDELTESRRRPPGTSSGCRKCSCTSIRGSPASCCRA